MKEGIKYSVVIPCYKSAAMVEELAKRVCDVMGKFGSYEIIFVDDNSPDKCWEKITRICSLNPNTIGMQLMKNSGQGNATIAGIGIANGEYIITMDDDLQHPPEEIPVLLTTIDNDSDCDVIIGAPLQKRHGLIRRLGSSVINTVNNLFFKKDKELKFTGFRVIKRMVAKELTNMLVPYPAIGPMLYSITHRIKNVQFNHKPRKTGKSNYTVRKLFKQTLANFIGYSMFPLRLLAFVGAVGTFTSMLIGLYFLIRYFTVGITVAGWTSLLLVLTTIAGFIFFAFGIIGEYILRITIVSSKAPQATPRQIIRAEKN